MGPNRLGEASFVYTSNFNSLPSESGDFVYHLRGPNSGALAGDGPEGSRKNSRRRPCNALQSWAGEREPDQAATHPQRLARMMPSHTAGEPQGFPLWFPNSERNQAIAEWLAFNFWPGRTLGVEPKADRYPYSEFNPRAVERFFSKLAVQHARPRASAPAQFPSRGGRKRRIHSPTRKKLPCPPTTRPRMRPLPST